MKLTGRRESTNVDDRRGMRTTAKMGGMGIGGIIIALLLTWATGGNLGDFLAGSGLLEGNVTEQTIANIAKTGVDIISLGALTHSVQAFDISMKMLK